MRSLVIGLTGIVLTLALASAAAAKKNNPNISLEFIPQQAVGAAVANVSGAMLNRAVALHVADGRQVDGPEIIGIRTDDDDRRHTLTATSDVLEYVETTLIDRAERWGVDFDAGSNLSLHVEVLEVDLLETNQAVGATYNATVRLAYTFRKGGGAPEVEDSAFGDATRYGKKFSNDNVNEVLSDALLEAYAALFSDRSLQRAWGE